MHNNLQILCIYIFGLSLTSESTSMRALDNSSVSAHITGKLPGLVFFFKLNQTVFKWKTEKQRKLTQWIFLHVFLQIYFLIIKHFLKIYSILNEVSPALSVVNS